MKLLTRHSNLVTFIFFPIVLISMFLILLHAQTVAFTLKAHWLFLIPIFIILFSPLGKNVIGEPSSKSHFNLMKWLGKVIGIEICFLLASYSAIFVSEQLLPVNTITHLNIFAIQAIYAKAWGLFPWSLIIIFSLAISYFCYNTQQLGVTSSTLKPLFKNHLEDSVGIYADGFIRLAILLSFVFICSMIILMTTGFIIVYHHFSVTAGIKLIVMLVVTGALFINNTSLWNHYLRFMLDYKIPYLVILLLGIVLSVAILFVLNTLLVTAANNFFALTTHYQFFSPDKTKIYLILFLACWWLSVCPILAGIFIYISQGCTWRQFIMGILIVPILLLLINNWFGLAPMHGSFFNSIIMITSFICQLLILFMLLRNKYLTYLIRATLPTSLSIKKRNPRIFFLNILQGSMTFTLFYWIGGISILAIIFFIFIISSGIIMLFSCLSFCYSIFRTTHFKQH